MTDKQKLDVTKLTDKELEIIIRNITDTTTLLDIRKNIRERISRVNYLIKSELCKSYCEKCEMQVSNSEYTAYLLDVKDDSIERPLKAIKDSKTSITRLYKIKRNNLNRMLSQVDKKLNIDKNSNRHDIVNKAHHYQNIKIGATEYEAVEIISSIVENLGFKPSVSWSIGDSLKYILRCGKKFADIGCHNDLKEKAKQDLKKAAWYLNKASELM